MATNFSQAAALKIPMRIRKDLKQRLDTVLSNPENEDMVFLFDVYEKYFENSDLHCWICRNTIITHFQNMKDYL